MLCGTSALGFLWRHVNHLNLLVRKVYQFHVCFLVRKILHLLGILLTHEDCLRLKVLTIKVHITV